MAGKNGKFESISVKSEVKKQIQLDKALKS